MFKSFAAFLFIAGLASASRLNYEPAVSTPAPLFEVADSSSYSVPIEANILESQQTYNVYPLAAYINQQLLNRTPPKTHIYVASSDPTYTVSPANVKSLSIPIPEKKVTIEAHRQVTVHPPTVRVQSSPVVNAPTLQYGSSVVTLPEVQAIPQHPVIPYVPVVKPVATVPVVAKKLALERYQTVTAFPPRAAYIVTPPETPRLVQAVNNRPAVQYVSVPAPSSISEVKTVVNEPAIQYAAAPVTPLKPIIVKEIETPKTETIESHQSVTVHPPTSTVAPVKYVQTIDNSPQYISTPAPLAVTPGVVPGQETVSFGYRGASQIHSAPLPIVNKPIPVPVIFSAAEFPVEQYLAKTKQIYPTPAVVSNQAPVALAQPVALSSSTYQNKESIPLVYTKTFVNQDVPRYGGYVKAVRYSPASSVSRVSFNGNGVSYGW